MLTQRSTVHRTKRGRILRHITEHYLRDDVYCGLDCERCQDRPAFDFPQTPEQSPYPNNASLFQVLQQGVETLFTNITMDESSSTPHATQLTTSSTFKSPSIQSTNLKSFLTKLLPLLATFTTKSSTADTTKMVDGDDNDNDNGDDDKKPPTLILIPETAIFLKQFDFMETQTIPFSNIVVLQSTLNHLKRRHYKMYQRLRSLCTTTTFQSSTLLKSNFESKSFSIGNSSKEQSINPHFYVFSDLFHAQVYPTAITQLGEITDDLLIPFGIDPTTITNDQMGDDDDDDEEEEEEDDDTFYATPTSFVQYVDSYLDPEDNNDNTSSHLSPHINNTSPQDTSSNTNPLDSEQSFEQRYLGELFTATNKWYYRHQTTNTCALGLTDNLEAAMKHVELGIPAIPLDLYISIFLPFNPGFESLYAHCLDEQVTRDRSQWVYTEHLPPHQIESGIQSGSIFSGKLNIDRDYWSQGSISTEQHGRVLIPGLQYMNRAFDGDLVAVKLWPRERWHELATGLVPDLQKDELPSDKQDTLQTSSTLTDGILDGTEQKFAAVSEDYIPQPTQTISPSPITTTSSNTNTNQDLLDSMNKHQFVPTGEVIGIIQQGTRTFCGSIEQTDRSQGHTLLLPHNRRIPKIFIQSQQLQTLVSSRLLVRVDSWPITSRHPHGHVTRILGNIGDNEAETEMVLIEHDIKHDKWSLEVEKCLPPPDYVIDDQERAGRIDLRGIDICSIDPPGCTDIDDALHCFRLPNGNYEAGVHIADVTHYMKPGSALDIEAAKRSTSVYLVDRRIDMIPARLSTNLCSLHEHVERLAFSTVWELTPDADIVGVKFFKSVILSRGAMTYAQAQERIDLKLEDCQNDEQRALYHDKLTQPCKDLMMLARKIKQKRFDKGALSLASTEVKFKLNQDRTRAEDMLIYQLKEANSLVEEFMLLANVSVAEHTLRYFPLLALLRGHPTPPEEMLIPLVKAAKSWGYEVDISNGKTISGSLDGITDPTNPMFNKVLRILTTRCMTQAKYMSSGEIDNLKQLHHFGLAANTYTHFTSPIRRYADCIVHRLLATSLGIHPLPEAIKDKAHMRDVVENLNFRHRNAQMASRASTDIWILKFFTGRDEIADAIILAVRSNGIRVIVQKYGIECAIRLIPGEFTSQINTVHFSTVEENNKLTPNQGYYYNPELMTLTINGVRFQTLQGIQIRLCVKENKARRRWLHVELAGKSQELMTTDLIETLHRETLQDSFDITPELLRERTAAAAAQESSHLNSTSSSSSSRTGSVLTTATMGENTSSAELYLDPTQKLSSDQFKPLPCDDGLAEMGNINGDGENDDDDKVKEEDLGYTQELQLSNKKFKSTLGPHENKRSKNNNNHNNKQPTNKGTK